MECTVMKLELSWYPIIQNKWRRHRHTDHNMRRVAARGRGGGGRERDPTKRNAYNCICVSNPSEVQRRTICGAHGFCCLFKCFRFVYTLQSWRHTEAWQMAIHGLCHDDEVRGIWNGERWQKDSYIFYFKQFGTPPILICLYWNVSVWSCVLREAKRLFFVWFDLVGCSRAWRFGLGKGNAISVAIYMNAWTNGRKPLLISI